jgi:hypothetical protein
MMTGVASFLYTETKGTFAKAATIAVPQRTAFVKELRPHLMGTSH